MVLQTEPNAFVKKIDKWAGNNYYPDIVEKFSIKIATDLFNTIKADFDAGGTGDLLDNEPAIL